MKILTGTAALALIAFAASCGPVRVNFRRVEINKKEEAKAAEPVGKKVPGQRRTGVTSAAYMLVGNELKRVTEAGPDAIVANQHYVSIALEEVSINGAGLVTPLILSFKAEGALPQGQEFQAVLGRAKGEDGGFFKVLRPLIVDPFVYRGQPLILDVSLTTVPKEVGLQVDKAKEVWGDVRHVDPNSYTRHALDAAQFPTEGSEWIRASFATKVDPSALPMVGGRYVVFSHPNPDELKDKVNFDERGLVWKDGNEPVKGVSYVTFFLNRRKRGPRRMETMMEQQKRTIEGAIVSGKLDVAKNAMEKWPEFIDKDPHITDLEKEFHKTLIKFYTLQVEFGTAKEGKDAATVKNKADELVKFIDGFKKQYKDMIEPAEVNDMNFKMRKYLREME